MKIPEIETGIEYSVGAINDFHRCRSEQCNGLGFFVNALGRTKQIRCPSCDLTMDRNS